MFRVSRAFMEISLLPPAQCVFPGHPCLVLFQPLLGYLQCPQVSTSQGNHFASRQWVPLSYHLPSPITSCSISEVLIHPWPCPPPQFLTPLSYCSPFQQLKTVLLPHRLLSRINTACSLNCSSHGRSASPPCSDADEDHQSRAYCPVILPAASMSTSVSTGSHITMPSHRLPLAFPDTRLPKQQSCRSVTLQLIV